MGVLVGSGPRTKMATFLPNPNDENELWIERAAFENSTFRIWHLMFFAFSGFVAFMILICCCFKFRIPRTKQEIEADYQRKKLATKFRERLKLIQNQEMDSLDLKRALEIIRQDYEEANENIELQVVCAETQIPTAGGSRTSSWRL